MRVAAKGDKVKVHYTLTVDKMGVVDSSSGRDPLAFTIGAGQMIKGFDEAVRGMKKGDKKKVMLEPSQGYGERDDDLVLRMEKSKFPKHIHLREGIRLQLQSGDGHLMPFTVVGFEGEEAILDGNHELAGKKLHFDIEMVEIS